MYWKTINYTVICRHLHRFLFILTDLIVVYYGYAYYLRRSSSIIAYNKIKMVTCLEDLPVELWISIFSYLEAHDLLQAFSNLNYYFDQIISSNYILFHVRLGKISSNPLNYSTQSYWPDPVLNRIVSLQPMDLYKTSHIPEFLRWHCTKLTHLKSLKVKLRSRETSAICSAFQHLASLELLAINCVPNQLLINAILSTPSIRVCHVDFLQALTELDPETEAMSNIERFSITLRNDKHNSLIYLFLNHMPKLQRLEIHSPEVYFDNRSSPFTMPLFQLPKLRVIKLNWSLMYCDPRFFESLHHIMPTLQRFELNITYNYLAEDFFENLVCHWWSVIESIAQSKIIINCHRPQITIDDAMQMNFDRFQAILLSMNENYHGLVKVRWSEKVFVGYKIIELSICKSSAKVFD